MSQSVMCEKWVAIIKVTVTEFGFIQWNHDYFYYMFWTAEVWATNLVWQCMFISWSVLWKCCFAVFKVKVTVKVLNFSECLPRQYLWLSNLVWWCIARSSEILKLLQSKLAWWYIITTYTRQGKTPWKDFLGFTQGVRQRIWLGGLWTRLLPLLALPISKTAVNTGSNQEKVERTLLLW